MKLLRSLALAAGAALALAGGVALAQQPLTQPPTPGMRLPSSHPAVPGMAGPGMPAPGHQMVLGPDGRPQMPGRPGRPGFPGSPPGVHQGRPPGPPGSQRPPAHAEPEAEHGGGGEHECAGHGPDDAPPPINLWHGLLMVNNERALQGGVVNQLLFRYENPNDPCDPKNEPAPYMASLINFAVLAFVLFHFGRKPLAESLAKRRDDIMAEIDTAQKLKATSAARLDEYEDKLENIAATRREMLAEFATQAEAEKAHVLAEAEERRARMRRDAEFRIEQELKAVRDELLREAVIGASVAAEALIQRQMSAADQDRMAADFLRAVGPALRVGVSAGGRS